MRSQKFDFFLVFLSAVMFCKHILAYTVHYYTLTGSIILSINIQVGLNMHLYDMKSVMHRRPFEGRHLVF